MDELKAVSVEIIQDAVVVIGFDQCQITMSLPAFQAIVAAYNDYRVAKDN